MTTTLRERIELHDNNYSHLKPFTDLTTIDTTIVIPVYNQAELFSNTWRILAKQNELNSNSTSFEVIVINDGSDEDIDSIVENLYLPTKTIYVKLPRNTGRSHARNVGIEESKNDLILFLDSDVLVPDDFFQQHWKIHNATRSKEVNIAAIGLAENIWPNDKRIMEYVNGRKVNPDPARDFRVYDDGTDWYPPRRESRLFEESRNLKDFPVSGFTLPEMVVTHSISLWRRLLRQVGGFEESFRGWGLEDTHLGAKIIGIGGYIIPVTTTAVFKIQHPPRDGGDLGEQCRANTRIYERLLEQIEV